jgi:hypothetical protein
MNDNSTFKKRKKHRMATWKGSMSAGFPAEELMASESSPEDNLSHLETLRKMVYPGLSDHRMNKNVTHCEKASPSAGRVHSK